MFNTCLLTVILDCLFPLAETPNKRTLPLNTDSEQTANVSLPNNSDNDEEQTILNISLEKLRNIEDPENCLRRSVLINNTLKCIRSGLRVTSEDSATCFTCPLPCKRLRLNEEPNYVATDSLKDPFEDYQGAIIRQEGNSEKERGNRQIDEVFPSDKSLSITEVNTFARQATKSVKRKCDIVRFAELEFPNVICALET